MSRFSFVFCLILGFGVADVCSAEGNWNQFRGPKGNGETESTNLPVEFGEEKNLRWKTAIHGKGWSSPVIWGDQIWLTTAPYEGTELYAVCVDLKSGAIVHDIKVFDVEEPMMEYPTLNTHASPTSVVEEGRVYVHYGSYGTAALDTETGEKLWENREYTCDHRIRPASSPIVEGDSLFLTFDGVDKQFIVALNKHTGETIWYQDRIVDSDHITMLKAEGMTEEKAKELDARLPNDNRKSSATPLVIEIDGEKQLISPAAEVTISYDLETGEENWRIRHTGQGFNVAGRPIYEDGLLFLTTGQAKRFIVVDPKGAEGDVTDTNLLWDATGRVSEMPSPLVIDGLVFMVTDKGGSVGCWDAKTGEQIWRKRLPAGGQYWASPLYADGKIYFSSQKGVVTVIEAARELKVIAENVFEGASFIASPAVAGDDLILRSGTDLYCFGE